MDIPSYAAFMMPLMHQLKDGRQRHSREAWEDAISAMEISEADQEIMRPNGRVPVADDRWAARTPT